MGLNTFNFRWVLLIEGIVDVSHLWHSGEFPSSYENTVCHVGCPRLAKIYYLYWQINDSRWNQACARSHQRDCTLSERDVPLQHCAGCSSVTHVTVTIGKRGFGKALDAEGKRHPHFFYRRASFSQLLVLLPTTGFWAKMFCQPEFFLAQCREIILSWELVLSLIFIPVELSAAKKLT